MGVIYALHVGDGIYRYVGKTVNAPEYRLRQHLRDAKGKSTLPVHRWIRKNPVGSIAFDVLYVSDNEKLLLEMEKAFIRTIRDSGHNLLNLTDGGEGLSGYVMPEEQKRLLSLSKTGRPGTPHSKDHKARMRNIMLGRNVTWGDKISAGKTGTQLGSKNPRALLSEIEASEIIELAALDEWPCPAAIAEYYDVSKTQVERIVRGDSWKHLPRPSVSKNRKRVTREKARRIVDAAFDARRRMKEDGNG